MVQPDELFARIVRIYQRQAHELSKDAHASANGFSQSPDHKELVNALDKAADLFGEACDALSLALDGEIHV